MLKASETNKPILEILVKRNSKAFAVLGTLDWKSVQIHNLDITIMLGNSLETQTPINKSSSRYLIVT